jgi:predicted dehydrogenase
MRTPIAVGVVGLGRRGPLLAHAFDGLPQAKLSWLCDHSPRAQLRMRPAYPQARFTSDLDDLLNDESLDAVVLATPAGSHYELARRVLDADKHVLVERPLALRSDHAKELVRRAERGGQRLLVANPLVFHPAVRRLKELVDLGHLGDLYYLYGEHHEPGDARDREPALWSLGASSISIVLHLLADEPVAAVAHGGSYLEPGITDVVSCHLTFATGIRAQVHLSLLEPGRSCRLTLVGSRGTATFDDGEPEHKLSVHDRNGEIVLPRLSSQGALHLQCAHFLAAIRSGTDLVSGGLEGLALVTVLEALERSLGTNGMPMAEAAPDPAWGAPVVRLPVRT